MRNKQKLITRSTIILVAKQMIEEDGFESSTIRGIAKMAGIATGTIFVHFKSKEELFYSAFYDDLQQMSENAISQCSKNVSLLQQLVSIGEYFFNSFASRPLLYSQLLERSLLTRGEWGKHFRQQVEHMGMKIGELYGKAILRGEISQDTHIPTAVMAFFSFYYFLLIDATTNEFKQIEKTLEMFQELLKQHIKGLQAKGTNE